MRILIFNWKDLKHPAAGGAEVFTHEVAKRWVEWGNQVMLFCASHPTLAPTEEVEGIRVIRRGGRLSVYRQAPRFYEREGVGSFDAVIDEVNTRPFMTPRFVRDVPVIALIHQVCREIWWYEFPFPLAMLGRFVLEPLWLKGYRNVPTITVSESSRESLADYGLRDITVVPEGLSLPDGPLPDLPKESVPTLLFVGRLARNKRPAHAIKAFRLLKDSVPDAKLWIVGTGHRGDSLRRKAPEGVTFWGGVSLERKIELMARAHLLVVPSVREGWGLIVSEGASVGTPSVAYRVAGLVDSISKSGMGVLVEPRPAALAEGLQRLLGEGKGEFPKSYFPENWNETAEAMLQVIRRQRALQSSGGSQ
ncbi:MAG: glycosyltransferase family 4 protein [Actinomycetota bacterium]|nr:glycosyltransferase family 4 protein [Actinomycetota bacterium]